LVAFFHEVCRNSFDDLQEVVRGDRVTFGQRKNGCFQTVGILRFPHDDIPPALETYGAFFLREFRLVGDVVNDPAKRIKRLHIPPPLRR